jgi:hypothetical protein
VAPIVVAFGVFSIRGVRSFGADGPQASGGLHERRPQGLRRGGRGGVVWLAVIAILNSVLSLAGYLSVVVPMYQTLKEAKAADPP